MVTRVQMAIGGNRRKFLSLGVGSDIWLDTVKRNCTIVGGSEGGGGQVGKAVMQPPWLEMAIYLLPWDYYHMSDLTNPRLWMSKFQTGVQSVSGRYDVSITAHTDVEYIVMVVAN